MEADFTSRCSICDVIIEPGDDIERNMDDEWCHKGCVEVEEQENA